MKLKENNLRVTHEINAINSDKAIDPCILFWAGKWQPRKNLCGSEVT